MTEIPYVAIGNDELEGRPSIRSGDFIRCPWCGDEHEVESSESNPPGLTLESYRCGDKIGLAGINGVSTMGMRLSGGTLDTGEVE